MNDQHPHAGYVGHDNYPTGSFDTDPLFGVLPDPQAGYEAGHSGPYDSGQWDTGSHPTQGYEVYAAQVQQFPQHEFPQPEATGQYATVGQVDHYATVDQYDTSGQWDASAWNQGAQTGQFETAAATFAYDTTGQWAVPTFESGAYDATAWNACTEAGEAVVPQQFSPEHTFGPDFLPDCAPHLAPDLPPDFGADAGADLVCEPAAELIQEFAQELPPELSQEFGATASEYPGSGYPATEYPETAAHKPDHERDHEPEYEPEYESGSVSEYEPGSEPEYESGSEPERDSITPIAPVTPRPVRRSGGGGNRGRRRTPAKRSALFTVAVPSACVMGVAGIAAASVGSLGGGETKQEDTKLAAADVAETTARTAAANNRMDTQLAALDAEARDFSDRASRTQERIDLKVRQEAERKKREEDAKRREALRPKFALPVKQKGLSTYYGESGVNWMALHTGIDFPVSYGSDVMAATDGTVRTQYNSAYGNMIIVTAPDGTETWYCHLSSAKIRSGTVKAGDVIGYAGNSGNSTGPHLHFEVRPGGGSTINPLTWLRSHGLDPT
ncbi:M23 family metallopeptidase [Streptomyces sp. NPDC055078]